MDPSLVFFIFTMLACILILTSAKCSERFL
jgi:hypothetical protein